MVTRRVVTGIDDSGKSYFVHDGPTPGHLDMGAFVSDEIWVDNPAAPDPAAKRDPAEAEKHYLSPPSGGSVIRILTFQPDGHEPDEFHSALASEAGERFDTGGAMEEDNPGMHTTPTIDYGIILSGSIDLELDSGEVHMNAGDVVVQRATRHAWRNRSGKPCVVAFVLIGSPSYA